MELTQEKRLALNEVRTAMYERLKNFSFTDEMLKPMSVYHLFCILTLVNGHRNYVPMFSHTVYALRAIFGDALFDDSADAEKDQDAKQTEHEKATVH